jgi:hypothetical protein
MARNNRGLITYHSFWELQSGTTTLFWSDSWQQLPALNIRTHSEHFHPLTTEAGLLKVSDFWNPEVTRKSGAFGKTPTKI